MHENPNPSKAVVSGLSCFLGDEGGTIKMWRFSATRAVQESPLDMLPVV